MLHEKVDVLVIFEKVVELNDVRALELAVHLDFLFDSTCQILRSQVLFVNYLERVYVL
jgi:hypothetical protein